MADNEQLFEFMTKMYADMQNEFGKMRNDMQNGFSEVNQRLDRVESRLDGVESRLDGVESRLEQVENRVTVIEQDHGKKLDLLFDGYVQNSETLNRIEKEVSKHEEIILRRVK